MVDRVRIQLFRLISEYVLETQPVSSVREQEVINIIKVFCHFYLTGHRNSQNWFEEFFFRTTLNFGDSYTTE